MSPTKPVSELRNKALKQEMRPLTFDQDIGHAHEAYQSSRGNRCRKLYTRWQVFR